jgi:hypothetical protein
MIAPPEALIDLLKPWADFYGHSKIAATIVTFLHVGPMLLGGGFAIAMDRSTLRALRTPAAQRTAHLGELAAVHRWVIGGLVVIVMSGLLLLAADIETFWGSWIYWLKMALVVALLVNGLSMTRAETALRSDSAEQATGWATLRRSSQVSLFLWLVIAFLGVALVNIA